MSSALEHALDGVTGTERIARAAGVIARHAREAGVEPVVVSGGAAVIPVAVQVPASYLPPDRRSKTS